MSIAQSDGENSPRVAVSGPADEPDYDRFFLQHQQQVSAKAGVYRNQRFVGRGGNGRTFLVTATSGPFIGLQLALKVFHKISNAKRRNDFLEEISYYKQFDHPSIIRFFDEGEYAVRDRVYPFVLVEYVPRNLQSFMLERSRRIERVTALRLVLNVTAALKYLHERHVPLIHRDIKPGNILISGEKARLADFGLAQSLEEAIKDEPEAKHDELISAAMPRFYRTPELVKRARGDQTPLTTASDIYQLGTVFYEIMTGFNPQERPERITDDILLTTKDIRGECGARILALIRRMLADDLNERPTAAQVMDDLLYIHRDYCFSVNGLTGEFV